LAGRFGKNLPGRENGAGPAAQNPGRSGVLIIQIDGLGYDQLLRAFASKRLPFLHRLARQDRFVLKELYSGLPSATPAMQAELFFGVKGAVPAFQYFDRQDHYEKSMFDAAVVDALAQKLEAQHDGLLAGGSSYGNIFAGGAREARFCIQTMKLESIFHDAKIGKLVWFLGGNLGKIGRIIGLALLEGGLAVVDFGKGIFLRKNPGKEFKFIFARIGVCIILRELVRLHVKMDIDRGLPVIHANFVGYDEHAHRRGPASAFALWTLKGIDATIKDLVRRAGRATRRDYRIIVYSDHGQEPAIPYPVKYGRNLPEAVQEVFSRGPQRGWRLAEPESSIPHAKLYQRNRRFLGRNTRQKGRDGITRPSGDGRIHITAMGPLGHIYLPLPLAAAQMRLYAERLVAEARIPAVFYVRNGSVMCATTGGTTGKLADKAREVFGRAHPFLAEVSEDMATICRHEKSGDFIISGWQPEGESITFPIENGAHGGPGRHETKGFVILPDTLPVAAYPYLRPLDLRENILLLLRSRPARPGPPPGQGAFYNRRE
jgi:hypothetical protein